MLEPATQPLIYDVVFKYLTERRSGFAQRRRPSVGVGLVVGGGRLSGDTIRADSTIGFSMFMFRIGSLGYMRMVAFRECVANNRGQLLFEVEDCGNPLPGGASVAQPALRRYR